jgi:TRAP-type C4-dicarboxylate transport system permease small subunit
MPQQTGTAHTSPFWRVYAHAVTIVVHALAILAGLGILFMVGVTCLEVILRVFGVSMTGVVDLVKVAAAVSTAAALPYATACKGHVAIEFLFQKLSRLGRAVVDTFSRVCIILLFGFLSVQCVSYGITLRARGQVTPTLQLPEFWVPYILAVSFAMVCLITLYHLCHPGKELIKP